MESMDSGKRITLKDIAKRAETSTMAVSVVLNGARSNTRVADATRRRITEIAATLNYSPNAMARGLRRQRTSTLGVLFNWAGGNAIHNLYSVGILDGVVAGAAEAGYHVLLYTHPWKTAELSSSAFSDQRTDGVIVVAPDENSDVIPGLVGLGLSVSLVSSVTRVEGVPFITIDNRKGVQIALDHLFALGHRRIAYVGQWKGRHSTRERYEGYLAWMSERGLPTPDAALLSNLYMSDEDKDMKQLLGNPDSRPTAILAFNDDIAVKVMETARGIGLSLPDDLSLVGFDDVLIASLTTPKLTTVRLPLFEMGMASAKLLVARIEGSDKIGFDPAHILVPELILRNSTAPPARR
ncbi:MAG: LacI family DNA-binding transcriptional regulator [Akkermansiaceae bacterium]|nr:LacI family DNA-binding transcriptional regulator [Armatimonadota bacterium]